MSKFCSFYQKLMKFSAKPALLQDALAAAVTLSAGAAAQEPATHQTHLQRWLGSQCWAPQGGWAACLWCKWRHNSILSPSALVTAEPWWRRIRGQLAHPPLCSRLPSPWPGSWPRPVVLTAETLSKNIIKDILEKKVTYNPVPLTNIFYPYIKNYLQVCPWVYIFTQLQSDVHPTLYPFPI